MPTLSFGFLSSLLFFSLPQTIIGPVTGIAGDAPDREIPINRIVRGEMNP